MFSLSQHDWWFCEKHDCGDPYRIANPQDRMQALLLLQQFKSDLFKIRITRNLLRRQTSLPVSRMADEIVLKQIVELLTSGQLHIHDKQVDLPVATVALGTAKKHVPFPFSPSRGDSSFAPPPPPVEPPTFSSNIDLSAQIATLVGAAAGGKPFCPE
jgi:hypothetical protein